MAKLTAAAYDPPVALEGANCGLVEAFAARLWGQRTRYYNASRPDFRKQSGQVLTAWRETAADALKFLFDIGFIGPAGRSDEARFEGWSYAWMYEGSSWEIIDEAGGYIALVRETPDLEVMLAAPRMRSAIKDLLASIPAEHPVRSSAEMVALEASLPENAAPGAGA